MAGAISDQTTNLSNVSLTGNMRTSRVSSTASALVGELWAGTSGVSLQGGLRASGVTFDLRTNSVIPSAVTYAGGASISGLTIGQWGFVFNASGFSIAYSSGATAYFFGGSTLSAAIT